MQPTSNATRQEEYLRKMADRTHGDIATPRRGLP
jgi:hypothetical protein